MSAYFQIGVVLCALLVLHPGYCKMTREAVGHQTRESAILCALFIFLVNIAVWPLFVVWFALRSLDKWKPR